MDIVLYICSIIIKRIKMIKYCLRHWRGDGGVIPDVVKNKYYDYPKRSMNRSARTITLAESIVQVISEEEFLKRLLDKWGVEAHNRAIKRCKISKDKLIKE